jgi:hypothetical protein
LIHGNARRHSRFIGYRGIGMDVTERMGRAGRE